MCLRCVADEGTKQGYCRECGCLIALFDDQPQCMPDECWCAKQPDVGDWHALADEFDASVEGLFPAVAETWPTWEPDITQGGKEV